MLLLSALRHNHLRSSHVRAQVLERTNAIVKEQFKVRSMLSGDAK
jgi:hypothetical protein